MVRLNQIDWMGATLFTATPFMSIYSLFFVRLWNKGPLLSRRGSQPTSAGQRKASYAPEDFVNVKGAKGNDCFFPAGQYLLWSTITVPPGSRLTGKVWSVIMATSKVFQDPRRPIPMLMLETLVRRAWLKLRTSFSVFMIVLQGPSFSNGTFKTHPVSRAQLERGTPTVALMAPRAHFSANLNAQRGMPMLPPSYQFVQQAQANTGRAVCICFHEDSQPSSKNWGAANSAYGFL
ncbi:hypothetical protein DFJ77DRAFT_441405 [Powellomyces hirtus]|nr:hypothetical protein DFJ77DRAFT_441405 [Powellomyces hirtus]